MSFRQVLILPPERLPGEGGGRHFDVVIEGVSRPAFAVRWHGQVYAYLNTCRHQALPLDFGDGHFFDAAFHTLVCRHHGARYAPDTGLCLDGPCAGKRLTALAVEERDGGLWLAGIRSAEA